MTTLPAPDALLTADVRRAAERLLPSDDLFDERLARLAWSVVVEPGDGTAGELVAASGARRALRVAASRDADGSRALADGRARWRPRWRPDILLGAIEEGAHRGMRFVTPLDEAWPGSLDDLGAHAPLALWVRGDPGALVRAPSVALVGARAATAYGSQVATDLAAELAASGVAIVSGAAYGVDGAAHRAALRAGGTTIAFVAGGADRVYPAGHAALLAQIVETGAVAAECAPGTTPTRWRFLARNRLIAALADATVVVEAGARSGTINTAGAAASLGRPLGAVPGPITSSTSAGCHRLLREYAAQCITGTADVRELLGELRPVDPRSGDSAETTRVVDALTRGRPRTVDEIAVRSGLSRSDVEACLGLLSLAGRAAAAAEGWIPLV
ncbi:DNA-processing protein DprA [Microbacterium indicum]|uniref:DNA-processing protein DprA n=1 Tax=Microbacterium indicum TaxID=358100 RepID=UPI000416CB12|nr:DNA-processing protein DprA [Microbacterium indicum]